MADEQQAKPSFKHAVAKKALAPLVASAATAATTYLMRKAVEVWHESVQPKLEEKGGVEAVARQAADAVSGKLAPVSEAAKSKVGRDDEPEGKQEPEAAAGRGEERRKREQRRTQRRKTLDQAKAS